MRLLAACLSVSLMMALSACCKTKERSTPTPDEPVTADVPVTPPATAPGDNPGGGSIIGKGPAGPYPMMSRQIPSSCSEPAVLLATVPPTAPTPYKYPWSVQTMVVHDDFVQVRSLGELASTPKSVMYFQGHVNQHRALVARCYDAATCNNLAAMYKTVIRTSTPQPACGMRSTGVTDTPVPYPLNLSLPDASDAIGQCARLNACILATDHSFAEDVGIQCQKAPHKYKLTCTFKPRCAAVIPCAGF